MTPRAWKLVVAIVWVAAIATIFFALRGVLGDFGSACASPELAQTDPSLPLAPGVTLVAKEYCKRDDGERREIRFYYASADDYATVREAIATAWAASGRGDASTLGGSNPSFTGPLADGYFTVTLSYLGGALPPAESGVDRQRVYAAPAGTRTYFKVERVERPPW